MINKIKDKLAKFIISKNLKEVKKEKHSFSGSFKKSFNFLVLMPEDESEFHHCIEVLQFLEDHKKNITIVTHDYRVSLIPAKYRQHVIEFGIEDLNKINLPTKKLVEKLLASNFNAVIDLNIKENLFSSYLSNLTSASLIIGFKKYNSDKYYNLQIANKNESAEISYKNLLNCLQMF